MDIYDALTGDNVQKYPGGALYRQEPPIGHPRANHVGDQDVHDHIELMKRESSVFSSEIISLGSQALQLERTKHPTVNLITQSIQG